MSSFGENELFANARIVGRIRILDVIPGSALFPRIVIRLGVTLHDSPKIEFGPSRPIQAFEVRNMRGELRLEENGKVAAYLQWTGQRRFVRSSSYGSENQIELGCDLDAFRIEKIEENRGGQEAVFWVALWPTVVDAVGYIDCDIQPIRMALPREKWVGLLGALTNSLVTVLEVIRPQLSAPEFKASLSHLTEARARITRGDFEEAIAGCRRAIESMLNALDVGQGAGALERALSAATDSKRGKTYAGIVSRLKELANYTIHRSEAPGQYTRGEAQFVLGSTEHAIALLASLLKTKVRAI